MYVYVHSDRPQNATAGQKHTNKALNQDTDRGKRGNR